MIHCEVGARLFLSSFETRPTELQGRHISQVIAGVWQVFRRPSPRNIR